MILTSARWRLAQLSLALREAYLLRLAVPGVRVFEAKLRAAYLRSLLRSVESDVEYHERMAVLEPKMAEIARGRAEELRVLLINCGGLK